MGELSAQVATELYTHYLGDCGYKEGTKRDKLEKLRHFLRFTQGEGITDLREVSTADIQRFLTEAQEAVCRRTGKPYSRSMLQGLLCAVKILFKAFYQAELVLKNPALDLEIKSNLKARPHTVFSEEEIACFLDGIDIALRLGLRDRAMFELMYSSGLRVSELGKLDRADIDLGERMLIIRCGKWSKDRMVPINGVAHAFLSLYLGAAPDAAKPAFVGQLGRLGAGAVGRRFRLHLRNAGLGGKGLTAHSIRHSTATHLLAHGADVRYVQELLGHNSIETTVVYTNELFDNLKRIYRRYHPRENALFREVDEGYIERLGRLTARLSDPKRLRNRDRECAGKEERRGES
jgi:integrase/recombinase XerD